MGVDCLSLGPYWLNLTAPLTCWHKGTAIQMDIMKNHPELQGIHTELGTDFVLLTMAARLTHSLISLTKNIMHKRVWCWKLLPSALMTKPLKVVLWMFWCVLDILLALEVTKGIFKKKHSTHKQTAHTGVTMSSVSIKYHWTAELSNSALEEEVSNIIPVKRLQDTVDMDRENLSLDNMCEEPLLPSCTNPLILSMICVPTDDEDALSISGESDVFGEWEVEDGDMCCEKEEMSADSGLQEFWTPQSKTEDCDEESDWSDSWDEDSDSECSKVDEDLWASFCPKDDPYNPLCFSMPTKSTVKSNDEAYANTPESSICEKPVNDEQRGNGKSPELVCDVQIRTKGHVATACKDSAVQEPGRKKRVRFSPDVSIHCMVTWSYAHRMARKGPWEEYARDRCRFKKRISETGDAISYCLTPHHRQKIWDFLYGRNGN
ncbi:protein phosphatase 1 regulatory subunit 15B-like [Pelobates fuscus]|uniref:protein phosphatase 1 regulatory subunit 15B-like n=1 Tax=Pelobates fuscus TaxID=191477 RepID=UPI002FE4F042